MKQVSVKEEISVTYWEAIDGTRFKDQAECEIYERSAKCLLLSKYNRLVIKKTFEFNIFGCGSEDGYVDIVKLHSKKDIEIIMQTLGVINPHMLKEDSKERYDKYQDILEKACSENDLVFIFRGYDNNSFYIEGALSDRIYNIAKACGHTIKYELMELEDETN